MTFQPLTFLNFSGFCAHLSDISQTPPERGSQVAFPRRRSLDKLMNISKKENKGRLPATFTKFWPAIKLVDFKRTGGIMSQNSKSYSSALIIGAAGGITCCAHTWVLEPIIEMRGEILKPWLFIKCLLRSCKHN